MDKRVRAKAGWAAIFVMMGFSSAATLCGVPVIDINDTSRTNAFLISENEVQLGEILIAWKKRIEIDGEEAFSFGIQVRNLCDNGLLLLESGAREWRCSLGENGAGILLGHEWFGEQEAGIERHFRKLDGKHDEVRAGKMPRWVKIRLGSGMDTTWWSYTLKGIPAQEVRGKRAWIGMKLCGYSIGDGRAFWCELRLPVEFVGDRQVQP